MSSTQVVFAHHIMDVPDSAIEHLFGKGKIGIDYGIGSVANPAKFEEEGKDTASINTMESLRQDGGIVVADYLYDDLRLLGYVSPGQNIEVIEADDGTKIKTLQLDQFKQVHEDEESELFDLSKGQQGVHNLNKDADVVREVFERVFGEATLNKLNSGQPPI